MNQYKILYKYKYVQNTIIILFHPMYIASVPNKRETHYIKWEEYLCLYDQTTLFIIKDLSSNNGYKNKWDHNYNFNVVYTKQSH